MQNNFDIHQQMFWHQIQAAQIEEQRAANVKSVLDNLLTVMNVFFKQSTLIRGDGDLTEKGRHSRLTDEALKSERQIKALTSSTIAGLDERIGEIESIMSRAAAGGSDDEARTLLKIEARQLASTIDPLLLRVDYLELCRNGADDLSCEALEQAPSFSRMLASDVLEEGRQIRAARKSPDLAEELRQVRVMRSALAGAASAAYREMAQHLPDPIERMAKGVPA